MIEKSPPEGPEKLPQSIAQRWIASSASRSAEEKGQVIGDLSYHSKKEDIILTAEREVVEDLPQSDRPRITV